jgi:phosphatidate cytidylyltransferase
MNDLVIPAAERVSLALAGGLGAILLAERRHLRNLTNRVLFRRWRTWAITAPLFGVAVVWSPWTAAALVGALSVQGVREYAGLVGLPRSYRAVLVAGGIGAAVVAVSAPAYWFIAPPVVMLAATVPAVAGQDVAAGGRHFAYTVLGFVYLPWLLGFLSLLRAHPAAGPGLVLALGLAVALSDVGAFAVGRAFGRHPLAPGVSPKKTWEGVAGNLAGAALGFALMSFAVPAELAPAARWALPVAVGMACAWGDLVESLLKRQFGVKDAGRWLPGFGGLLDRIDSLLVALPIAYALVEVAG